VNRLQKLLVAASMMCAVFILFGGNKAEAAITANPTTLTPTTHRTRCNAGTPVDFSATVSSPTFNLTTGVVTFNVNVRWERCGTGTNTRAYAIYANDAICPLAGYYGSGGNAYDCVKYIGNPEYNEPGSGLACFWGTNEECVTDNFVGARESQNQPPDAFMSQQIPMSYTVPFWWVLNDNTGSYNITGNMCQFYKTGTNFTTYNDNRCMQVSVEVAWTVQNGFTNEPIASIVPTGSSSLENPTTFEFRSYIDSNVNGQTNGTVQGVTGNAHWYYVKNGVQNTLVNAGDNGNTVSENTDFYPDVNGATAGNGNPRTFDLSSYNLQVGDRICARARAAPYQGQVDTNGVIQSTVVQSNGATDKWVTECIYIENRPYVRFYGADLMVGGGFAGSGCNKNSQIRTFNSTDPANTRYERGSGSQFAAMSMHGIYRFSSGVLGTAGSAVPPIGLSFSNTRNIDIPTRSGGLFSYDPGGMGMGQLPCIKDYYQTKDSPNTNIVVPNDYRTSLDVSTLTSGSYFVTPGNVPGATLTLNPAGDAYITGGKHIVLYVDGDVFINNDISYLDVSWASEKDIPSLYVVAKGNIRIRGGVSDLAGVYVAQPRSFNSGETQLGVIFTCALSTGPYTDPATSASDANFLPGGACNNQLRVNGAFVAQYIRFLRTANTLRNSYNGEKFGWGCGLICISNSAESFHFSPTLYLSDVCDELPQMCKSNGESTGSITSLPPIL
jgi:hypothetical protein